MTSVIRHTAPALVRNISQTMPVISLQATLSPGLYVLAKTYRFPRGKDIEVLPEDFVAMEPEINRLVLHGHLQITRNIVSVVRSTQWRDDCDPNIGINKLPEIHPVNETESFIYLKHFNDDPTVAPDLVDDALWIIDHGTGNVAIQDVDVRVRIAGQTYSLLGCYAFGSHIDIPFFITDWLLAGDLYYCDIKHMLGTMQVIVQVWEGSKKVLCHQETTLDANTVRLYVTADPDARFDGRCSVFKAT